MSSLKDAGGFADFDLNSVPSPCYVINLAQFEANLQILSSVSQRSGADILLALKAFSLPAVAPLVQKYLSGVCASGLFEARFGRDKFGGPVHSYGAAYPESHLSELIELSDHLVFNSLGQLERAQAALAAKPNLKVGLRLNPEVQLTKTALYDPSAPHSRLGLARASFTDEQVPPQVSGFHCHNLCGNHLQELKRTVASLEEKFPDLLARAEWINLGGGHAICEPDYDREGLVEFLQSFAAKYQVKLYLEPGETTAYQVGGLVTTVLDTSYNGKGIAILDCSSTAHIPDSIEMPYRVDILGAGQPGDKPHDYRLGGLTCLSGDVMGDYSFDQALEPGQRLLVEDTAYYTMVKTTTFNGVGLPAIATWDPRSSTTQVVAEFGYEDFCRRLG